MILKKPKSVDRILLRQIRANNFRPLAARSAPQDALMRQRPTKTAVKGLSLDGGLRPLPLRERAERTQGTEDAIANPTSSGARFLGRAGASFGPARGRHDDGSAEACRSGSAGVSAASELTAASGTTVRSKRSRTLPGKPARDVAGDNVTPADYRTALLSR